MKYAKRYIAIALSFALFLALPLAFTQEAAAASKKPKVTQLASKTTTSTDEDGTTTSTTMYQFNKKGLSTEAIYSSGRKEVKTYNKSGYCTSETSFDKDGLPQSLVVYRVKKGKKISSTSYRFENGSQVLSSTTKYTYKKGKLSKVTYTSADGKNTSFRTYRSNGMISKYVYTDPEGTTTNTYDKKGNITSQTSNESGTDEGSPYNITASAKYKNTYKKGKLVKVVMAETRTYSEGSYTSTTSNTETTTYKYKKGKLVSETYSRTYNWTNPYGTTSDNDYGSVVYTYRKGRLVKEVRTDSIDDQYNEATNSWTKGTRTETTTYAYTKSGLLKNEASTTVRVRSTGTTSESSSTTYSYKKTSVNKKCVEAVKAAMETHKASFLVGILNNTISDAEQAQLW